MSDLRVAVCTNRDPAALRPCLTALALQGGGAGTIVVANALDDVRAAALERLVRSELPGALLLREPVAGLSRARNRAVAECAADDVIAFIDDDALVGTSWLEQLRAAWQGAGERTAVIGGPIRARFAVARPRWLTDALLPALTVLDYGDRPQQLDPHVRTLYGANVSFRVGPLRAAGGFDPRFGHAGDELWFSEEDEVQRALAAAGWEIRYDPGVWVWHVIPPERVERRALVRRRFRYGATLGARGGRSRLLAAWVLARAGGGALVAFARRDEPRAMERAVRAAENAGVLAARLVAPRR